jgi:hypothetical protein
MRFLYGRPPSLDQGEHKKIQAASGETPHRYPGASQEGIALMTSSIVVHDPNSGVAVAVATKAFAVGGFLPVRASAGAVPSKRQPGLPRW